MTTDMDDVFTEDTTHKVSMVAQTRSQSDQNAFENLQRGFNDAVAAVKVSEPKRDVSQNQRFRYELNWNKLRAAARNYAPAANARGIKVLVPIYYPPPNTSAAYIEFEPEPASDGRYNETGGRACGLGLPGSGSGAAAASPFKLDGNGRLAHDVTVQGVTFSAGMAPPTVAP